jgi:hypothetical protein
MLQQISGVDFMSPDLPAGRESFTGCQSDLNDDYPDL